MLERWVGGVLRHHRAVIASAVILTVAVTAYVALNFRIDANFSGMISQDLPFQRLQKELKRTFPSLTDTIVIIVEADTAGSAMAVRDRLVERLRADRTLFRSVYAPGASPFFERNGLLYLKVEELEDFGDRMAAAQPFLALLSDDISLPGIFSVVNRILVQPAGSDQGGRTGMLLEGLAASFESAAEGRSYHMPWQEIMFGPKEASAMRRQFIIVRPYLEAGSFSSGEAPIDAIRHLFQEFGSEGVRLQMTGDVPLDYENLKAVRDTIGIATFASLLLVALVLYLGLGRSFRLIWISLATLVMGLLLTTGFAMAFIGSLNMISVTFAVLYIGLGIDYSIQYCLRYRELRSEGVAHEASIMSAAGSVGRSLFLSCVTTAMGFFAFIPTAYVGVAQLGLIAGTGMFISFFSNITLLPAFLAVMSPLNDKEAGGRHGVPLLTHLPYRFPRQIVVGSLLVGVGAVSVVPRLSFDYNPLNLYNQRSESVIAAKALFKDTETPPWTISVIVGKEEEARLLAARLSELREVKTAAAIFDFVPSDQGEKLGIISDIALFLPQNLGEGGVRKVSYDRDLSALQELAATIRSKPPGYPEGASGRLAGSIEKFLALVRDPERGRVAFDRLREAVLSDLPLLFRRLKTSLEASRVSLSDLPPDLVDQYVGTDGRYRIQVFPKEDIMDPDALARFVGAVREVAPGATDAPVTISESGRAIVSSFRKATLYALFAILVFLLLELRSLWGTILILVPLLFAMVLTGAASALLGIPLNFANVVVIPLLLGSGVHSGILFVLRYQENSSVQHNMLTTSTSRAILFSSLTTMVSTGSLSFSSHQGITSIGILLSLCFGFLIFSTLILLPAMIEILRRRQQEGGVS